MYAIVNNETDIVEAQSGHPDQDQQGPQMPPPEVEGYTGHWIDAPIDWSGKPSETSVMRWNGGDYRWEETATREQALAEAIAAIDAAADAARRAAIGDPARALEYQQAEAQSREYRSNGYFGIVPPDVESWASAKGWTGQRAADDIIATADNWRAALSGIRNLRLTAKEAARNIAADPEGTVGAIRAIEQTFLSSLTTLAATIA